MDRRTGSHRSSAMRRGAAALVVLVLARGIDGNATPIVEPRRVVSESLDMPRSALLYFVDEPAWRSTAASLALTDEQRGQLREAYGTYRERMNAAVEEFYLAAGGARSSDWLVSLRSIADAESTSLVVYRRLLQLDQESHRWLSSELARIGNPENPEHVRRLLLVRARQSWYSRRVPMGESVDLSGLAGSLILDRIGCDQAATPDEVGLRLRRHDQEIGALFEREARLNQEMKLAWWPTQFGASQGTFVRLSRDHREAVLQIRRAQLRCAEEIGALLAAAGLAPAEEWLDVYVRSAFGDEVEQFDRVEAAARFWRLLGNDSPEIVESMNAICNAYRSIRRRTGLTVANLLLERESAGARENVDEVESIERRLDESRHKLNERREAYLSAVLQLVPSADDREAIAQAVR